MKLIPNVCSLNIALFLFYYLIFVLIRTKRVDAVREILESHLGEIMRLSLDKNDSLIKELESVTKNNIYTEYSLSILKTKIMKIIGQNRDFKSYIHDSSSPIMVLKMEEIDEELELKNEAIVRLIDLNVNLNMSSYHNQTSILEIGCQVKSILKLFNTQAHFVFPSCPIFITGSRVSMYKIFSNLLKNSEARISRNGKISIEIIDVENHIEIIYSCVDKSRNFHTTIDTVSNKEHQGLGTSIIQKNINFLDGDINYVIEQNYFRAHIKLPKAGIHVAQIDIVKSSIKIDDEIPLSMFKGKKCLTVEANDCSYEITL
jgi:hypothetical protein